MTYLVLNIFIIIIQRNPLSMTLMKFVIIMQRLRLVGLVGSTRLEWQRFPDRYHLRAVTSFHIINEGPCETLIK